MKQDKFFDGQIIDLKNQAKQREENPDSDLPHEAEQKQNIVSGIRILGKWIYFERRLLAEETITMMVPKCFADEPG